MARGGATEVGSPPGGRIGHGALGEDLVRKYLEVVREREEEDWMRGGCVGGRAPRSGKGKEGWAQNGVSRFGPTTVLVRLGQLNGHKFFYAS